MVNATLFAHTRLPLGAADDDDDSSLKGPALMFVSVLLNFKLLRTKTHESCAANKLRRMETGKEDELPTFNERSSFY